MEGAFKTIINEIGEDSSRAGLLKSPARAAKSIMFFTKGYADSLDGKKFFLMCLTFLQL